MESVGKPAPNIDVDQLAAQVMQIASSQQLVVVPGTPVSTRGWGYLVLLDHHDLSAAEFCALAAAAGARLLYVQAEGFNAGNDPDIVMGGRDQSGQEGPMNDRMAEFRRYMENFNGRIRQLELAFAIGCVLHCWAVAADWYVSLVDRTAEMFPPRSSPT
jgi:hypothetical protein